MDLSWASIERPRCKRPVWIDVSDPNRNFPNSRSSWCLMNTTSIANTDAGTTKVFLLVCWLLASSALSGDQSSSHPYLSVVQHWLFVCAKEYVDAQCVRAVTDCFSALYSLSLSINLMHICFIVNFAAPSDDCSDSIWLLHPAIKSNRKPRPLPACFISASAWTVSSGIRLYCCWGFSFSVGRTWRYNGVIGHWCSR